jgi:hypothetical protein
LSLGLGLGHSTGTTRTGRWRKSRERLLIKLRGLALGLELFGGLVLAPVAASTPSSGSAVAEGPIALVGTVLAATLPAITTLASAKALPALSATLSAVTTLSTSAAATASATRPIVLEIQKLGSLVFCPRLRLLGLGGPFGLFGIVRSIELVFAEKRYSCPLRVLLALIGRTRGRECQFSCRSLSLSLLLKVLIIKNRFLFFIFFFGVLAFVLDTSISWSCNLTCFFGLFNFNFNTFFFFFLLGKGLNWFKHFLTGFSPVTFTTALLLILYRTSASS